MDTKIDKPVKRPVPKPKTGQLPKRGDNGQFLPGAVGNPKGRPRGCRNRASVLMKDLLDARAKARTEKAIKMALTGDVFALRLCLDRMMPVRRERSLTLHLPAPGTVGSGSTWPTGRGKPPCGREGIMNLCLAALAGGTILTWAVWVAGESTTGPRSSFTGSIPTGRLAFSGPGVSAWSA